MAEEGEEWRRAGIAKLEIYKRAADCRNEECDEL
jgi:hypothetical protein